MKSRAMIVCCFMFLSVFYVSAVDAVDYTVYLQSCTRGADKNFTCNSASSDAGLTNLESSSLESILAGYGCTSYGALMFSCSTSSSSLAQSLGYRLVVLGTTYPDSSNIYMLYLFHFNN